MTIFRLTDAILFPPCDLADPDGLLAVGGDLSPERLLVAYSQGIFPWYSQEMPILWWSPDPRLVLFPDRLKVSKSLERVVRKGTFKITFDGAFAEVMKQCALIRLDAGEETWITQEMWKAYVHLYQLGYAHSVEAWLGDELVGGLYGLVLGKVFFGESMFARVSNASKVAFVHLVRALRLLSFELVDCQVTTAHLMTFGAEEIPRREFLRRLANALEMSHSAMGSQPVSLKLPS